MAPDIPDRWIPYDACGKVIEGTKFICFKVPLRKQCQIHKRDIKEIWDIPTVLERIPNLGIVIDLTNTSRYYDPKDFLDAGVLHKKITMPGRIIPSEEKVQEFTEIVDDFLGKDGDCLIGVHCTHGLNRTGYMICRYMRDRLNIPAEETIYRFEKARGYKMEREVYLGDIRRDPSTAASSKIRPSPDSKKKSPSPTRFSKNEPLSWRKRDSDCNSRSDLFSTRSRNRGSKLKTSVIKKKSNSTSEDEPYDFRHDY